MGKNVPGTPNTDIQMEKSLLRDPDEDYFMMAVLSLKMIHNEKYEDADYCFYMSPKQLYQEVLHVGMPFHLWYIHIEAKFNDLREQYVFKNQKMDEMEDKMMEFQVVDPQIDIIAKKTKKKSDSMAKGFFKRLTGVMTTKNKNAPNFKNSFENFSETSSKSNKREERELKVVKKKRKSIKGGKAAYAAAGAGGQNLSGSYWLS